MTIGKRIKQIREIKNISRSDLAKILQKDISSISKIENDKQIPSAEIIAKICEEYNIDGNWILLGIESDFLTDEEKKIIKGYRRLTDKEKGRIEEIIDSSDTNKIQYSKIGNL